MELGWFITGQPGMKGVRPGALGTLTVNVVLLGFVYLIFLDRIGRDAHAVLLGYTPTTSYSLFTVYFQMAGRGVVLPTPPAVDWVQVIVVILAVYDTLLLLSSRSGAARKSEAEPSGNSGPANTDLPGGQGHSEITIISRQKK